LTARISCNAPPLQLTLLQRGAPAQFQDPNGHRFQKVFSETLSQLGE